MEGFNQNAEQGKQNLVGAVDVAASPPAVNLSAKASIGSSVQTTDFETALNQSSDSTDHAHSEAKSNSSSHVSLDNVASARNLNAGKTRRDFSLSEDIGKAGDLLDPGSGKNTITGSQDKDVILGNKGGFNTITAGAGRDSIVLGEETTNKITDFDLSIDRLMFDSKLDLKQIVLAQGKNTAEGAIDSTKNALLIDKREGHILGSLANVDVADLAGAEAKGLFKQLGSKTLDKLSKVAFANVQEGDGQLTGSSGRDKLVGRTGDDTLIADTAILPPVTPPVTLPDNDHDHTGAGASSENHIALDKVDVLRDINVQKLQKEVSFADDVGTNGDFVATGGGKNVVIGTGSKDLIDARGGGFNTITTGGGQDSIVLDGNTTNRILDFDPTRDRLLFAGNMDLSNVVIAQGKNPGKGGIKQPLDSTNNTLIIDKTDGHILASIAFTKASAFQNIEQTARKGFSLVQDSVFDTLESLKFDRTEIGDGKLTGARGRDKMVGSSGDDFFYVGDDGFKIGTAKGIGAEEFPFANDSPGTSEATATLKNGVLSVSGKYRNFDGAPLFSQNEQAIDPKATILNGSDPVALINGFLKVPNDVEGNPISGTHLHFSPALDSRGNFADATVLRYFTNTATDAKSGTVSGKFNLTPEEQAAFLAGDLYMNIHTNVDVDGDGKAGFPTGENRLNFNQNVVQLA